MSKVGRDPLVALSRLKPGCFNGSCNKPTGGRLRTRGSAPHGFYATDNGTSSIKSASCAVASALGVGRGFPFSKSKLARSSIALATISRASGKSNP